MSIRRKYGRHLIPRWALIALFIAFTACGEGDRLVVDTSLEITETTRLSGLTIAEGASITAPEGFSVTLTVDGVETQIAPGTYEGAIVLTVAGDIINPVMMGPPGGGEAGGASSGVRAAIYVDGGAYLPEKSVPSAVPGGNVTDDSAADVTIRSTGKDFNGVIVTGDSVYTLRNLDIDFDGGDQGNNGAAITSAGNADVTVTNASIVSKGVQRAAIVVGGSSTMHVDNSDIETYDGALLQQFAEMEESNSMEVPWVLGFIGNNRATNVVQNGTAYYNNTHVKTQRWGCLSTDAAQSVELYATNCRLETVESGYGAYADNGCSDVFDGCRFDVNDYGFITSGGSGTFTNGCVVNSGRFGAMAHGSGALTIDGGSEFNAKKAVIQVKSAGPTIVVDNARLNSESGIILEAIVNDDPWKDGGPPGGGMPGGGPPGDGMPGGAAGGRGGGMPGMSGGSAENQNVSAVFRNTTLMGDIVTSMTTERDVIVRFENAIITGAITTATSESQADIDGVRLNKKTYYYIGEVKNTYRPAADTYGLKVFLDGGSQWIVDETSYLTALSVAEGAAVVPPEGCSLTMTVDGAPKEITAGEYAGDLRLTVTKL